jgi:hypothetical protein
MKKILFFLAPVVIFSCLTEPQIRQYNINSDTTMYFLPASAWNGNNIQADIDFNFKNNINIKTICNISIRREKELPSGLSNLLLNADSIDYYLYDIKILLVDSRTNMVRITATLSHADFLKIMKSKNIYFEIIIDEVKYKCTPSRRFLILQNEFQNNYFIINNILR